MTGRKILGSLICGGIMQVSIDSLNQYNKVSYLVIACRGHLEDQQTLIEALKTPAFYIGLLGSKKKVKSSC